MKNIFQAVKNVAYPTVPAIWPNRAIRRALRFARSVPQEWVAYFDANPHNRALAKAQGSR